MQISKSEIQGLEKKLLTIKGFVEFEYCQQSLYFSVFYFFLSAVYIVVIYLLHLDFETV